MPKLPRLLVKQFGASGVATNFGQFGSKKAAAPQTSQDPSVIMNLAAWVNGWTQAAVGARFNPYLEDMNGFCLTVFYFLANIFERGIPDYSSTTTYYAGALCQDPAVTGDVYVSLTDNNLGNALPGHAGNAQWRWWNPSGAGSGLNADMVDGLHASATPEAGKLLALDGSARFPSSVFPGAVVQSVRAQGNVFQTVNQVIPDDDTIPQQSEGLEILTAAITPTKVGNKLRVRVVLPFSTQAANSLQAAVFQDATVDAIAATFGESTTGGADASLVVETEVTAGALTPTTFKLRVGMSRGTGYICGRAGSRVLGGAMNYTITVDEIAV